MYLQHFQSWEAVDFYVLTWWIQRLCLFHDSTLFLSNKNSWKQIADYRNPSSSHFTQTPSQAHYASLWSLHILSLVTGSKAKWFVNLHEHAVQQYSNPQWCSPLRWRQSLNTYYIPPERSIHQCVTDSLREHLMQRVGPTRRADPPTKLPEEINHLPVSSKLNFSFITFTYAEMENHPWLEQLLELWSKLEAK